MKIKTWPIALACVLVPLACLAVFAGTINLSWEPAETATGYKVGYGLASSTYTEIVNVGNTTTAAISVPDCTTYYLAVKGTNPAGESPFWSNEVSGWGRPYVTDVTPAQITAGETTTLHLTGGNFMAGFSAVASDPLVTVNSTSHLGCNTSDIVLSTSATMPNGMVEVEIINPDQVYGVLSFDVVTILIPVIAGLDRTDQHDADGPPVEPPVVEEIVLDNLDNGVLFEGAWELSNPARWNRPCIYGETPESEVTPECVAHQNASVAGEWFSWLTPISGGTYEVRTFTGGNAQRDPANTWEIWNDNTLIASTVCTETTEPTCSNNTSTSGSLIGTYTFESGMATIKVIGSAQGTGTLADQVTLTRQ